ncbi:FapA family protein [Desulfoplanes formicivorans]|uniref:Polymerase n=1 Tax=Desulfoplanes formicivorans TaxID=1592317 RepID=A0A194ACY7_9BACT|nr:FapA family protein [Desulfoplanes formicivorans]GAU07972.1 hypothetical protein DPF_0671 [Desulfoplanes formicivorans]
MPYFLNHHFDPDFDHQKLSPKVLEGGSVDHRKLGYVQNVLKGDVLANWMEIPPHEVTKYDPRFIYEHKAFPMGRNCLVDPESPDILRAGADGYVFYLDGTINVKKVLNVRGDVDYHTGDIRFVSDIIIHGSVRSGFRVRAENIRVHGNVNGATILANRALQVDGGIKGAGKADIRAKRMFKARFCENAFVRSGRDMLIDGTCYHSDLLAVQRLVIKGRLQGGCVACSGTVFVQERIGCGMGGRTQLMLGCNPVLLWRARKLDAEIASLKNWGDQKKPMEIADSRFFRDRESMARRLEYLLVRQRTIREALDVSFNPSSRLVVPGEVLPGVDIRMGPDHFRVEEPLRNVCFFFRDNALCHASPA